MIIGYIMSSNKYRIKYGIKINKSVICNLFDINSII